MTITIDLPDTTLAALRADAGMQGWAVESVVAEHLAPLCAQQDSLDAALEEAFAEAESGQGQPFDAFAGERRANSSAAGPPPRSSNPLPPSPSPLPPRTPVDASA